ncbi:ROK family transcriptional regulator [Catenulispora yoronensis]|uniref:ROK family transcriptional regulator n=1 Tax=Catenulispora yoronensis TaxID=450799 RepID=A0ABP5G3H7_9ACTN
MRLTGLSRATVSVLVNDLVAAGIVQEDAGGPAAEPENRSMGRPPLTLALNRAIAYAVGVDIGHAHVRVALCDLYGTPVWEEVEAKEVDRAPHETLDLAARLVHRALAECEVPAERVLGLGGGIAAPVDGDGALSAEGILPGWTGIRPGPELAARTGLPTEMMNDANAGALAEHRHGAGRGVDDMIYIRLSAGIGAGVIASGRLQLGAGGLAGEVGHLPAVPDGRVCRCGNRGCLETIASPVAVARLLQESWNEPVTPADLPALLANHRPGTTRVIEDTGEAVGRALATMVTVLNPRLIVVGGDLAPIGAPLFESIQHAIARHALPSAARQVTVTPGRLGPSAEARGAAARILTRAPRTLAILSGADPGELPIAAAASFEGDPVLG